MRRTLYALLPAAGVVATLLFWLVDGAGGPVPAAWRLPLLLFGAVQGAALLLQAALWGRYRQVPQAADAALPHLTVVIPAYNEGAMVRQSIGSVLAADYPADRLELVVVDDGSRDDTLAHIEAMQAAHPGRPLHAISFPRNRGKRAALVAGFRRARGSVVATLDSDSVVSAAGLRWLVAPLCARAAVGAVAGQVKVLDPKSLLGHMLEAKYGLAFDYARAAESTYGTVLCCSGALSAVRLALVRPHLDAWLNEQFLGRPVGHGEDQALTNIVLASGHDTVYQRDAVVHTVVPQSYGRLCRMLLRWDRGYIVEGLNYLTLVRRGRQPPRRWLAGALLLVDVGRRLILYTGLGAMPWLLLLLRPDALARSLLLGGLAAACAALACGGERRGLRCLYGMTYSLFALFYLYWIFPWALLTVRDGRWGTR